MSELAARVERVSKSYGAVRAVKDASFEVPRGSVFALLGPNGSGKTTLFGVMCGFLRPTEGRSEVLGLDSRQVHRLRGRLSALPQDALVPRYVNVLTSLVHYARLTGFAAHEAETEARRVLDRVGLGDRAGARGSELSHGMAKRVGLAQALIGKPEVIVLDEPTAGLDPKNAREVKDLIATLRGQTTVLVSSHNLAEIQEVSTHGVILDKGVVAWSGSMDELTKKRAEVSFEVRGAPPVAAISAALGAGCTVTPRGESVVHVAFDPSRDVADVIDVVLRTLLDAKVPVLGVQRGTSLEAAFLKLTEKSV